MPNKHLYIVIVCRHVYAVTKWLIKWGAFEFTCIIYMPVNIYVKRRMPDKHLYIVIVCRHMYAVTQANDWFDGVLLNSRFPQNMKPEYHVCIPCDEPVRTRIDTRDVLDILWWEKWLYDDWCQLQQQCCRRYLIHLQNPFGAGKVEKKALYLPNGASIPHKPIHCPFQCRTQMHQTPARKFTPCHVFLISTGIHPHIPI